MFTRADLETKCFLILQLLVPPCRVYGHLPILCDEVVQVGQFRKLEVLFDQELIWAARFPSRTETCLRNKTNAMNPSVTWIGLFGVSFGQRLSSRTPTGSPFLWMQRLVGVDIPGPLTVQY